MILRLAGPPGDQGPPGKSGATGAVGATGTRGDTGAAGSAGAQGLPAAAIIVCEYFKFLMLTGFLFSSSCSVI